MSGIESQYQGRVRIVHMDVDRTERDVLQKYRVRGTPTFALYDKDGKLVRGFTGWPGERAVAQMFDQLLGAG